LIGTILRIRYELLEELEPSPLFTSFKAKDRVHVRDVRIRIFKQPYSQETAFVESVQTAIHAESGLGSSALEQFVGIEDHEGNPFLVSALAPGQNLSERIKRLAPFSPPVAVALAIGLAEGLQALHQAGKVHGDVASRNVCVAGDGTVTLLLPGIWQAFSSSKTAGVAMLPSMAPYLAPEVSADGMPHPGSDVYSLGVLLYELVTGRLPYSGDTTVSVATKHATAPTPSARAANASVPYALDEVIKKAMAKSPADRYPTATEMLRDLRRIQDALRFGRPLAGPLDELGAAKAAGPQDQRVAPKMSAVPEEVKNPKRRTASREPREADVPRWLMGVVYVALSAAVVMIGIWVYSNLNKPKLLKVPNIVGKNVNEAYSTLTDMHLTLRISKRQATEKYPEDTVIDTNPQVGAAVRENSHVSVVVSSGSKFVEVPDLRGLSTDEAKALLSKMGLEADTAPRFVRDRNIEKGKIVGQVPEARTKVERLSRVRFQVSGGPSFRDGNLAQEPNTNKFKLKISIPNEGEEEILVRVEMIDENGSRTVHEEPHLPGSQIEVEAEGAGADAVFKIFFDNQLVKQVSPKPESPESP